MSLSLLYAYEHSTFKIRNVHTRRLEKQHKQYNFFKYFMCDKNFIYDRT